MSLDDEWSNFLTNTHMGLNEPNLSKVCDGISDDAYKIDTIPKCDELYISTKTKVLFLKV